MQQEQQDEQAQIPDEQTEPVKPLPMLRVYGEGYVTRKNGEVVPFTIQGEG